MFGKKRNRENTNNIEYRRYCNQCGSIWHFTENDLAFEDAIRKRNIAKALTGLCSPLVNMPLDHMEDYQRCHSCGSRNVTIDLASNPLNVAVATEPQKPQMSETMKRTEAFKNRNTAPQVLGKRKR
jgi:transcriptional regulator NrdR family protein